RRFQNGHNILACHNPQESATAALVQHSQVPVLLAAPEFPSHARYQNWQSEYFVLPRLAIDVLQSWSPTCPAAGFQPSTVLWLAESGRQRSHCKSADAWQEHGSV